MNEEIMLNFTNSTFGVMQETYVTPQLITSNLLSVAFYAAIVALIATMILMRYSVNYRIKKNIFGKERKVVDLSFKLQWIKENKDQFIKVHLFILIMLCLSWIINHLAVVRFGVGI